MTHRARPIVWLVLSLAAAAVNGGEYPGAWDRDRASAGNTGWSPGGAPAAVASDDRSEWRDHRARAGWEAARGAGDAAPSGEAAWLPGAEPWSGQAGQAYGGAQLPPDWRWDGGATESRDPASAWQPRQPGESGASQYRFRGDPPAQSQHWGPADTTGGYRFRPLTERESGRQVQMQGWRPIEGERDRPAQPAGAPGLMDALTPPERTYGFEPRPWP
jgi:hypothetical protein